MADAAVNTDGCGFAVALAPADEEVCTLGSLVSLALIAAVKPYAG